MTQVDRLGLIERPVCEACEREVVGEPLFTVEHEAVCPSCAVGMQSVELDRLRQQLEGAVEALAQLAEAAEHVAGNMRLPAGNRAEINAALKCARIITTWGQ